MINLWRYPEADLPKGGILPSEYSCDECPAAHRVSLEECGSLLVCTTATRVEHSGSVGPLNLWVNRFGARLVTDDDVITASAPPRISRSFFFLGYQLHPPLVLLTWPTTMVYSVVTLQRSLDEKQKLAGKKTGEPFRIQRAPTRQILLKFSNSRV